MAAKLELLYEGKAKKVYRTENPRQYIVEYKDDATAFNGQKRGSIAGKGIVNNRLSNLFMQLLAAHGIPTHLVEPLSDRETLVEAVRIVPLEVVVRNLAAGSMAKRLGLTEGTPLARPIVEFYYKNDDLGDPLVTDDHVEVLGLAPVSVRDEMRELALRVNDTLSAFLRQIGVTLVDFKLEFGLDADNRLLLADEISPDTCRFWDAKTQKKLDKDRFRRDLGDIEAAYQEILSRVEEGMQV
ncbi:MAG: phosphoribosylaminoimidazolesuccinocarboxamide synthase [Alicyclobacillus herbarius]|uniref:phosphoribosylaminoimidazolesuccinocarboxamide synthase n=1 Tax=Alicyclobacillus herbarius TaxID=122960 RepID=UPI0023528211|nr:phosphoribosylaminoimidazolesuccinocarboxamide synthase [Alicyclobacillus herbarius]MCL6632228.1 phosphoribosylaminoimidazolesuccinocarboxamide synthase [Alicyclobacillus herbarius]